MLVEHNSSTTRRSHLLKQINQGSQSSSKSGLGSLRKLVLASSTAMLMDKTSANDYLQGNGQFGDLMGEDLISSLEAKNWIVVSPDSYDFEHGEDWIKLTKKEKAEGFFDDGLTYVTKNESGLVDVRPRHIHFEVKTETGDVETCDLRFYTVEEVTEEEADDQEEDRGEEGDNDGDLTFQASEVVTSAPAGPNEQYVRKMNEEGDIAFDVALFRLGYYNYAKLNTEPMVHKFKADEWYVIDLILDWSEQQVSIYVNNKGKSVQGFFTTRKQKIESGNALSIYGLSPEGVSMFRNIRMCEDICPDQKDQGFTDLSGAVLSYGMGLLGATAMLLSILA